MEGEKELLTKIKNSIREGLSDTEITRRLLARGYKIEYVGVMLNKAKIKKRVMGKIFLFLVFMIISIALFTIYKNYLSEDNSPQIYALPNAGINTNNSYLITNITEVTPSHISSLLLMMGVTSLHKNPLTFDKPKICFKVDSLEYLAIITGKTIKTEEITCKDADINIVLTKEEALGILNSKNKVEAIKQSISNEKTSIELIASKLELGAKGYLSLQETLSTK